MALAARQRCRPLPGVGSPSSEQGRRAEGRRCGGRGASQASPSPSSPGGGRRRRRAELALGDFTENKKTGRTKYYKQECRLVAKQNRIKRGSRRTGAGQRARKGESNFLLPISLKNQHKKTHTHTTNVCSRVQT